MLVSVTKKGCGCGNRVGEGNQINGFFPANYEETESRGWYAALLLAMIACYALTLTGIILLYVYYTTVSTSREAVLL